MNGSSKQLEDGEAFLYEAHIIENTLLKIGFPYDAIQQFTPEEVQLKIAIHEITVEIEKKAINNATK